MPAPTPRSDSVRNRARILEAADEVFGDHGVDAPTSQVAERAHVGIATVFRHFPTKEELLSAVLVRHLDRFTQEALDRADDDTGIGFFSLVHDLLAQSERKRLYAAALNDAGIDLRGIASDSGARFRDALGQLLRKAQSAGIVRSDATVEIVIATMAAYSTANAQSLTTEVRDQVINIVLDGLRPPST